MYKYPYIVTCSIDAQSGCHQVFAIDNTADATVWFMLRLKTNLSQCMLQAQAYSDMLQIKECCLAAELK